MVLPAVDTGLVMRWLCALALSVSLAFLSSLAVAGELDYSGLPPRSQQYLPMLLEEVEQWWPEMENPSIFAAQVDVETCASPTHRMCWSPNARLKTSREEGYGLGQITRAWDKQGRLRFDSLEELRKRHMDALSGWSWGNVANALFQVRGLILMNRDNYAALGFAKTRMDRYAFMDAAYNGGLGGVMNDRAICARTPGCDPNRWFGNVENTSKKARTAASGYGKGFFYVNREHVDAVVPGIDTPDIKPKYGKSRRSKYQRAGLK